MAKAKSLLEQAKAVERTGVTWQSRMNADELEQVCSVVDAFNNGELPTWSVTFLHDWLREPARNLATFKCGKTQFVRFVRERQGGRG